MPKFGTSNALIGYFWARISTLEFVKNESLHQTVNFGIGPNFFESCKTLEYLKLFIFYNKIFNDIREAKKIDSLLGDLFSMEYKYNFKVFSTSYTSSIYLNISNIKRTFLFDFKLHFTFEKQQLLLIFINFRNFHYETSISYYKYSLDCKTIHFF